MGKETGVSRWPVEAISKRSAQNVEVHIYVKLLSLFTSISELLLSLQDVDVRLIGTLYTRSLARRYLATTLVNKWYPFNCFQLVCELLYGRVPCYVTYTRDVVDDGSKVNAKDQDLVLSKVSSLQETRCC